VARPGRLAGIPIGVKDLFATERRAHPPPARRFSAHFVPRYESTVTAQLWRDGAVLLGKLNNDEFAMGSSNETIVLRPVINPWRRAGSDAN